MKTLSAALLVCACMPAPPGSVSIDDSLNDEQKSIVLDSIQQWCDAVGWCPLIALEGEARIGATSHYHSKPGSCGHENGWSQVITLNLNCDPSQFHISILHELGHYGIDGHTKCGGLMDWFLPADYPAEIDQCAIDAWRD